AGGRGRRTASRPPSSAPDDAAHGRPHRPGGRQAARPLRRATMSRPAQRRATPDLGPVIIPDPEQLAVPTVIPPRQPKPKGVCIWVTRETFDRLAALRARTGQPI